MKTCTFIASCVAGLSLLVTAASAQVQVQSHEHHRIQNVRQNAPQYIQPYRAPYRHAYPSCTPRYYYPSAGGYGYGNYYGGGYHPTYEQGLMQGYAALIQAQGQANYLNAQAEVSYQEAQSRATKNSEQATAAYFHNRKINKEAREADRPKRLNIEQLAVIAKKAAPERLTAQEYDSALGRLSWPTALRNDAFAADREAVNRAFRSRSLGDVEPATEFSSEVQELSSSLQKTLKSQIATLDAGSYVAAKKFLTRLAYESQLPMVLPTMAMR